MSRLADRYESRFPGALSDDAQKQEREERLVRKGEPFPRRSKSTRSIVVPALPLDENGRLKP